MAGTWAKLWQRTERQPSGCLIFTGKRDHKGYGRFWVADGKYLMAHRVAWELTFGAIPDGLCVLHRCDNPPCVEPAHLFLGTKADNAADKVTKGRHPSQRKTACPAGHPYDDVLDSRGHRKCGECRRAANTRYRQKRAA